MSGTLFGGADTLRTLTMSVVGNIRCASIKCAGLV